MKKMSVSVIVPAYNEEKTVGNVLGALVSSKFPDEIICVNDGSTDNTLEEIERYKDNVVIVDLKENKGKGYALAEGIRRAKGDILIFLDADLLNISDAHLEALLDPILSGEYKAVLGYLVGKSGMSIVSDLTGQRAYYKKDLLAHLKKMENTRFGVEVFLNGLYSRKETKKIALHGLRAPYKYEKNPRTALNGYITEGIEIAKIVGNKRVLPQSDFRILKELEDMVDLKSLENKIREISDTEIRDILEKYILRYIRRM